MKALAARTPYCCGLYEIGAFGQPAYDYHGFVGNPENVKKTGYAYICVTRWSDIKEKVWLRKMGFKKVGRWKNPNTKRMLTLWARMPGEKKKKRK